MANIFTNYGGDEDFNRAGYEHGKGTIPSRLVVVTAAAIDTGEVLISGRLRHRPRTWEAAQRKMAEYLLALRLPVSRLALVCETSGALSKRATDPIGSRFRPSSSTMPSTLTRTPPGSSISIRPGICAAKRPLVSAFSAASKAFGVDAVIVTGANRTVAPSSEAASSRRQLWIRPRVMSCRRATSVTASLSIVLPRLEEVWILPCSF